MIPLPRVNDSTIGDMVRELIELREALAKANAIIEANSNRDAGSAPPVTLTEDQIRSAIAKGKADRARLSAAGWQHGLLPKRPPYCHGQCVNAPEGEPPMQRTFNTICAGCVAQMDQEQQTAVDDKVRADFALLMRRYEAFLRLSHTLTGEEKAVAEHDAQLLQAARDTADPAYWRGQAEGSAGTIRALARVLDGPIDAVPCFGSPDLTALAKRLLSMRAELAAVHGDLGDAVLRASHAEAVLEQRTIAHKIAQERVPVAFERIIDAALEGKAKLDGASMEAALDEVRRIAAAAMIEPLRRG